MSGIGPGTGIGAVSSLGSLTGLVPSAFGLTPLAPFALGASLASLAAAKKAQSVGYNRNTAYTVNPDGTVSYRLSSEDNVPAEGTYEASLAFENYAQKAIQDFLKSTNTKYSGDLGTLSIGQKSPADYTQYHIGGKAWATDPNSIISELLASLADQGKLGGQSRQQIVDYFKAQTRNPDILGSGSGWVRDRNRIPLVDQFQIGPEEIRPISDPTAMRAYYDKLISEGNPWHTPRSFEDFTKLYDPNTNIADVVDSKSWGGIEYAGNPPTTPGSGAGAPTSPYTLKPYGNDDRSRPTSSMTPGVLAANELFSRDNIYKKLDAALGKNMISSQVDPMFASLDTALGANDSLNDAGKQAARGVLGEQRASTMADMARARGDLIGEYADTISRSRPSTDLGSPQQYQDFFNTQFKSATDKFGSDFSSRVSPQFDRQAAINAGGAAQGQVNMRSPMRQALAARRRGGW